MSDNIRQFTDMEQIKLQAGEWLVKLDSGDITVEQAAELQAWMAQSSFHRNYLEKLAKNWDDMSILQELSELFPLSSTRLEPKGKRARVNSATDSANEAAPASIQPRGKGITPAFSAKQLAYASFASVALVLCAFLFVQMQSPQVQQYATAIGENASYTLDDGTTVTLNTNSRIKVDYSGDLRTVSLQQGEANFDVAKNPNRPFVVYAGKGMVWAVGTAFNVRYNTDSVDVTVTEGVVKVYSGVDENSPAIPDFNPAPPMETAGIEREALVEQGHIVTFSEIIKTQGPTLPEQTEKSLAWQKGALIFKGETLEQAIAEIARYTDKDLVISTPGLKNMRVGGHYKTDDIDSLLDTFGKSLNISVTHVGSKKVVISEKSSTGGQN